MSLLQGKFCWKKAVYRDNFFIIPFDFFNERIIVLLEKEFSGVFQPEEKGRYKMNDMHTISVLVENKFGALARIAGLFSGRGYNIESLTVNRTEDSNISRMTIVTTGDDAILEQIEKQLLKLVDVIGVTELNGETFIERELVLVKIKATHDKRPEILSLVEIFDAKIANVQAEELAIEVSGTSKKVENFIKLVEEYGIIEIARTGRTAISSECGSTDQRMKTL